MLDDTDYRILRVLAADGRASDVTIGQQVNLSSTAVARRRKILESIGVIRKYSAELSLKNLGFDTTVVVFIELSSQKEQALTEFEEEVRKSPSVSYCSFVSGDTDFVMMLHVRSFEDYDRIYRSELSRLPHIARIRSSLVMRSVLDHSFPQTALIASYEV